MILKSTLQLSDKRIQRIVILIKVVPAISSVVRQKGESQNGCFKTKHAKFSEKRTFLTT